MFECPNVRRILIAFGVVHVFLGVALTPAAAIILTVAGEDYPHQTPVFMPPDKDGIWRQPQLLHTPGVGHFDDAVSREYGHFRGLKCGHKSGEAGECGLF